MICVAELSEISVRGILFEEFVFDISDDVGQYVSKHEDNNTAVSDRVHSNGSIGRQLADEVGAENLSASALEEAAAASAKPDKHFNLFKEAVSTNSAQVYCCRIYRSVVLCE